MPRSARKWLLVVVLLFASVLLLSFIVKPNVVSAALAQAETLHWEEDPVVTEVGKSAARARQLLYWTMSHPAINRAQVISGMWAFTRNIVYVFFIIVIAVGGIGIVVSRRQGKVGPVFSGISSPFAGLNPGTLIMRIAALLVYATFSYVFVLGLIEFAQILQNFFIEKLEGCSLFNINFGEATKCLPDSLSEYQQAVKSMESNYRDFVGQRLVDPNGRNLEMINTSLFYIRLTTLTYNLMSYIMILRDVVLWFLMVVAPILALLMPFTFIRNVGWIWIGVFLQWLFYGPLFALFIGSVVKIWNQGIPYGFDFSRTPEGMANLAPDAIVAEKQLLPFKTSINILWGGPAQTLDVSNSANYIDTFAEYVVSLIMLWVAIMLPWLLLRIFRDYCCDILKQNQGTLKAIYSQLRSNRGPDKPPSAPGKSATPAGIAARAMQLPFRKAQEQQRNTEETVRRTVSIEKLSNVKNIKTNELSKSLNITVNKLQDLARIETNESYQRNVREQLDKIANPAAAVTAQERQQYSQVRNELVQRAKQGDSDAARILQSAAQPSIQEFVTSVGTTSAERLVDIAQKTGVTKQQMQRIAGVLPTTSNLNHEQQVSRIIRSSELTNNQVQNVVSQITQVRQESSAPNFQSIADNTGVALAQVEQIASILPHVENLKQHEQTDQIIEQTRITKEQAEEVLSFLTKERGRIELARIPHELPAAISVSQIKEAAETAKVTENQVGQVVRMLPTVSTLSPTKQIDQIARETDITQQQAAQIIDTLVESKPIEAETEAVAEKVSVDDYEEVKSMWLNHYRNSTVPLSGKIKSRSSWIEEDLVRITNALNLLQSDKPEMKEAGLSEVEKILPFLLLGGFNNDEMVVYMKAKLEAAKTAMEELQKDAEKSAEATKEVEKVFVERGQVQEELAQAMKKERKLEVKIAKNTGAKPLSREDSGDSGRRAQAAGSNDTVSPSPVAVDLGPVLKKLDLTLRKLHDIAQLETDAAKRNVLEQQMDELNIPRVQKDFGQVMAQATQTVDDLDDVKNLWIRYYREAPVPQDQGFVARLDWIKHDVSELKTVVRMLRAGTQEQYDQAQEQYGQYLQFVMLGKFALSDIASYLGVRLEAAEFVAKELELGKGGDVFQGQDQELVEKVEDVHLDEADSNNQTKTIEEKIS